MNIKSLSEIPVGTTIYAFFKDGREYTGIVRKNENSRVLVEKIDGEFGIHERALNFTVEVCI